MTNMSNKSSMPRSDDFKNGDRKENDSKTRYSIVVGKDTEKGVVVPVSSGLPRMELFIPGFAPKRIVDAELQKSNANSELKTEIPICPPKPKNCDEETSEIYDRMSDELDQMFTMFKNQEVTDDDDEKVYIWNNFVASWGSLGMNFMAESNDENDLLKP